jgi:hypothetical protein
MLYIGYWPQTSDSLTAPCAAIVCRLQPKPTTPNSYKVVTEDKYSIYFKIFKVEGESARKTKPKFHGWGQETIV